MTIVEKVDKIKKENTKQDNEWNEYIFEPTKIFENCYITDRITENIRLEKYSSIIELDEYSLNKWNHIDIEIMVQIVENGVNKEFILHPTPSGQGRFSLLSAEILIPRNSKLSINYGKKTEKLRMKIRS
jgi:hypothetical protein